MSLSVKKILSFFEEDVLNKGLNTEIFSSPHLNKVYQKTLKVSAIIMVYLKFILNDYNYESNIKSHIKKIFDEMTRCYINIFDNFWMRQANLDGFNASHKDFTDKYNRLIKTHKIQFKNTKSDFIINQLGRNIESVSTIVKQFSK